MRHPPTCFWIALLTLGIVSILVAQGVSLSDIGIPMIILGGGKLLWNVRKGGNDDKRTP